MVGCRGGVIGGRVVRGVISHSHCHGASQQHFAQHVFCLFELGRCFKRSLKILLKVLEVHSREDRLNVMRTPETLKSYIGSGLFFAGTGTQFTVESNIAVTQCLRSFVAQHSFVIFNWAEC